MKRSAALLLPLLLAGCSPPPAPAAGDLANAILGERAAADRAMSLGRWSEAAAHLERGISLLPPPVPLDGPLGEEARTDLYNLACARAMDGRTGAALDALEQAMADGTGAVGFDLLAEDPDLASLRGEPRWKALVGALSWNEDLALLPGGGAAVVVVVGEGPAAGIPGAMVAVPAPPYRAGRSSYAWTTRLDPGEQAAAKAVFALRKAEAACAADPARRVLRASGEAGVRLAWEILLRRPGAFSRAVLDGPAPPRRLLLDRGAEKMGTEILVTAEEGVPDPVVGARVRSCGSLEAAWKEALR
jgi:hypothetical protein